MQMPFTRDQFFDLFGSYNAAWWPAVLALWLASLFVAVRLLSYRRTSDRLVCALLAVHWAWSAVVYHAVFFTRINPAAWLFAAAFLVQAALFVRSGVMQGRLRFDARHSAWVPVAWVCIGYALVYPVINAGQHSTLMSIPTFGVPCPTTIFTAGLLMLARPRSPRLSIVPIAWAGIAGSAAFLLGVRADYALPVAGVALAIFSFGRRDDSGGGTSRQ